MSDRIRNRIVPFAYDVRNGLPNTRAAIAETYASVRDRIQERMRER